MATHLSQSDPSVPGHSVQVFAADALFVSQGANLGDMLQGPDEVCLGDVYELEVNAAALRLVVTQAEAGTQTVAPDSDLGSPGDHVRLEARYALMGSDGDKVELLVLMLGNGARFALPLSPVAARMEYTLLAVESAPPELRLADLLCVSFARGTQITLANGAQRSIEDLVAGDRVLTRDHGAQPVRWIGRATLRAVGAFAPVVIPAGVLGNAGNLIVSQHHRMFLYQPQRAPDLPTAEVLVQARYLADDETIFIREGGFVDYFSLVFDHHEIIYAEGVPAESLMVTEATVSRLPPDLADDVRARFPGLSQNQHFGTEAGRQDIAALASKAQIKR
ncbi:MAG: Hint domain-containing protein [Paracoccaceae bacterium]